MWGTCIHANVGTLSLDKFRRSRYCQMLDARSRKRMIPNRMWPQVPRANLPLPPV